MIRYNSTYQKRADDFIKQEGWCDFALYVGHYHGLCKGGEQSHDWLAFLPMHADSICRTEGLPQYVLVDDDETIWALDGFDVMEETYRFDNLAKGRRIYRELLRKYEAGAFAPDDDKDFICHLMLLTHDVSVPVIPLGDAYLFLQEAKRLSRRLTILKDECEPYLKMLDR